MLPQNTYTIEIVTAATVRELARSSNEEIAKAFIAQCHDCDCDCDRDCDCNDGD